MHIMKVDENKNQKLPRKLRKIIVEKKRRERIDGALKQIKDMLFGTSELQNDYMRMEKADILESVVKYLQTKQSTSAPAQSTCHSRYNQGYVQCVREVTRLMTHLCGGNSQITHSLSHYLNTKVTTLKSQATSQERLHTHAQNLNAPKTEDILRMPSLPVHTETTSASGIPTNQEPRLPAFHSPQSAFHRVSNSNRNHGNSPAQTAAENISIAVYQYNHYNNFKNDKSRGANVESNINIRPGVQEDSCLGASHRHDANLDVASNLNARSNINIHPVVHKDSQSQDTSLENQSLDASLLSESVVKAGHYANQPFVKQESDMWRPW